MKRYCALLLALVSFCFAVRFGTLQVTAPKEFQNKEKTHSDALEALSFWTDSRAYPNKDIPADKFYKGFMASKRTLKHLPRSPFTDYSWNYLGPVNLSGRTIGLALNPVNGNTIYAGSASGGLWRSYSGGVNADWERVSTGYPVLGVNAIAIDPVDTNTMYIGTGEVYSLYTSVGGTVVRTTRGSYGIGILKTTDNGTTWHKSLDRTYNQQSGIEVIKINPLNTKTVWAGTTEGVLKSTDGGITWNYVFYLQTIDLVIHPVDTNSVIVSSGNFGQDAGVYVTTDGGANWNSCDLPYFTGKTTLAMCDSVPNTVYASIADDTTGVSSVWRSDDFGKTWNEQSDQSAAGVVGVQGWYSHYIAVKRNDPNTLIYGGIDMVTSVEGGVYFEGSYGSYSDHHTYALHPTNPNIVYDANDDGVYRSTDFGAHFTYASNGYNTGQFYNGFSNSASDSLLAIGQVQDHIPGYLYTGGASWSRSAIDECGWTAINPSNDNIIFAVSRQGGSVYRSTDRGSNFGNTPVSYFSGSGAWSSPVAIAPSKTNIVYFGDTKVYRSASSGSGGSWVATNQNTNLDGDPALSLAVAPSNENIVYVGTAPIYTNAHVWKTTNGGSSWINVTNNLPDLYPNDIAIDPNNSNIVYTAMGGFGTGHFFKSTDAGTSWSDITHQLADVPGTAVLIDPTNSNTIFAGNDIGVFISTDAGVSWSDFSEGLPEALLVSDLTYSPSNRSLRVTTHGNGVFERKLPQTFPQVVVVSPNGNEFWEAAQPHTIQWLPLAAGSVNIEYSTDNGSIWMTIVDSLPSSYSSYTWTPPIFVSNTVKVRVSSTAKTSVNDVSDAPFSIYFGGAVVTTKTGWQLVSLPEYVDDPRVRSIFPNASTSAFSFVNGYQATDSLELGKGYWLKFTSDQLLIIRGDSIHLDSIAVTVGWNLIGAISANVPVSSLTTNPPGILSSFFFGYANGYATSDTLETGHGYWIKTTSAGKIVLTTTPGTQKTATVRPLYDTFNCISFKDAAGNSQALYFGRKDASINTNSYEFPPVPPAGVFDVRFASQNLIASYQQGTNMEQAIQLHSISYPVTVSWDVKSGEEMWSLATSQTTIPVSGKGLIVLNSEQEAENLRLIVSSTSGTLPTQTRLLQNYPNPFNPSTRINFEIGQESPVTIKIYDALGREVAILANETMNAGSYSRSWNASQYPSGVYIVQLTSGTLNFSKKILLMK